MATWSTRRRASYALGVIVFLLVVVGIPVFRFFYTAPTCFDGIRNQNELGIDCGGQCTRLCASAFIPAKVLWTKFDKVAPGMYNLGAYIVNRNVAGGARNVQYVFKVYDAQGVVLGERKGMITLVPQRNILAFEPSFLTQKHPPSKVTFEFIESPQWEKALDDGQGLIVKDKEFSVDEFGVRVDAVLENPTLLPYQSLDVYAILYDISGNTLGFSKTKVDGIDKGQSAAVTFTWAYPREADVASIEIIPIAPALYER